MAKEDIDFDGCKAKVASFDQKAWERCVRDHFEGAAQGVIELEQKAGKNDIEKAKQTHRSYSKALGYNKGRFVNELPDLLRLFKF